MFKRVVSCEPWVLGCDGLGGLLTFVKGRFTSMLGMGRKRLGWGGAGGL